MDSFWTEFGQGLDRFWTEFGQLLDSFWTEFAHVLTEIRQHGILKSRTWIRQKLNIAMKRQSQFSDRAWTVFDRVWTGFGQSLDSFWTAFGQGLDRFWTEIGQFGI